MVRLFNTRVMVSLLCALVPTAVACGGGDAVNAGEVVDDMGAGTGNGGSSNKAGSSSSSSSAAASSLEGGATNADSEPAPAAGAPSEATDPGDTEAPTVLGTLPLEGATGVKMDAVIDIEFSEAMDTASVESAYQSDDLPAAAVSFTWNAQATKLTVKPLAKLEYAGGKTPAEVLAKGYVITIGSSATDLAANPMAEDATLSFTTLREILASLPPIADLSGHVDLKLKTGSVTIQAGDTLSNNGDRGLLSFDLSSVPADYQVLAAQIVARQSSVTNKPFDDLSANAEPAKLTMFDTAFANRAAAAGLLPGKSIGPFSNAADAGSCAITVTGNVETDLADRAARNNLTQYALQFPVLSDAAADTDKVQFVAASLEFSYYTP